VAFLTATRLDPRRVAAWIDLGTARARRGKLLEAIVAYEEALRLDPARAQAREMLFAAQELARSLGLLDEPGR
jgi:cytochrome c-type biogenesis protein CcmH/NrfG